MTMLRAIIALWGVWCLFAFAHAGVPESPRLRVVGVADGLPSSSVNGMAHDRSGYLWVATDDGLARYDGIGMQVWRHVPGDATALPGNYITAVHVDSDDRVWVATEGRGISVMGRDRAGFRHYRKADYAQIGSDDTFAIASRAGVVWFGTFGGGLHRLGRDGRITRFMPKDGDARSLPSETVVSLAFDEAGELWVGTRAGLARWTGGASARGDFDRLALPGEDPTPVVYSVTPEHGKGRDMLWIGASTGVFRRHADGRWDEPSYSAMFGTPNAVLGVIAEGNGYYWFGTQRSVWRVAPGQVPVPAPIGARGPVRPIQQMLRQPDGAMWFPVAGGGLGYLRPDWRRLAEFSREQGSDLAGDQYRAVTPATAGGWWLVGGRGEIERLDPQGQLHPVRAALQVAMERRKPISGIQDRNGRLWIGNKGAQGGLLRVDLAGEVREWRHDDAEDATFAGQVDLIALAPDGTVWLSCSGAGLQQRDADSGQVLSAVLPGPAQGLGVGDLEAMAFAADGALWIAGEGGLSRWNVEAQRFERAIDGDRVFAFDFDGADGIWLQRLSGLEHYRRERGKWRLLSRAGVEQGVPAVEGSGLRIDARGRVWLSSLRGLYRWDPQAQRLRHFGLGDGLSSREFVDRALAMGRDGVLAAALVDGGVVLVDTLAHDPAPRRPPLHLDRIEVRREGRWVPLDRASVPVLSPTDRELRVQLRLLAFDDPVANRYFTRLDGYDRDWIALGASGERVFANLPAATYTLRSRALDAAGNAATEQILRFTVQPPWWRTTWALAGFIGLVALLLWWAADAYRGRLKRRHALQLVQQQHEMAEQASQAKTRFLATLGHEVRTPMTGVLGMSELMLGTPLNLQQRGYLNAIRSAGEHLLRLVNDALDLARIESGKLELADEPFDLRRLVDELAALVGPLARQRGLAFEVAIADDAPRGLRGDASRVRQILLNLLANAVKFTERGRVSLVVSALAPQGVRFDVVDTGPGLNDEQKSRLFRRFEQAEGVRTSARYGGSGLGLAISQELAAAMAGQIGVDSAPGVGTRFGVSLPLPTAWLATSPTDSSGAQLAQAQRSLSLLLVEDDPIVAEVIVGLLRLQGHHVVHAAHGLTALAEVATVPFDAALVDLDLPGMDGMALARQLRTQGFGRPLIAITARADAEAEPGAIAAGFDHFIRKPVTTAMLATLLENAVPEARVAEPVA
jgi:signal transduction histidine kinase/ActR/RegA family two-component response regulator/sugar lactone lactonase YvrE